MLKNLFTQKRRAAFQLNDIDRSRQDLQQMTDAPE